MSYKLEREPEPLLRSDYPSEFHQKDYTVEYARTSRSHCHRCHEAIRRGVLRVSRVVPASTFEGDIEVWYHPSCMFAETWQHPLYIEDIEGLEGVNPEDQRKLLRLVERYGASEPVHSDLHFGLCAEYARSGHSECRGCFEDIDKDELRLGILVHPPKESAFHSVVPEWHHELCFFNRPDYWELDVRDIGQFAGFKFLASQDLRTIEDLIRMKADGQTIPGAKKVANAWEMKERGEIERKMSRRRVRGLLPNHRVSKMYISKSK